MSDHPPDFSDFIERHREQLRELCRRYAVTGDDVGEVLELAGREVLLRLHLTADPEGRFLRAVERHCREHFERHEGEHRKRIFDLLAEEEPPESEGGESAEGAGDRPPSEPERCHEREEGKR